MSSAKVLVVGAGVATRGSGYSYTLVRSPTFDVRPEVAEQIESMGAEFVWCTGGGTGRRRRAAAMRASRLQSFEKRNWRSFEITRSRYCHTTALIPDDARSWSPIWLKLKPGSVVVDSGRAVALRPTEMDQKVVTDNSVTVVSRDFPSRMAAQPSTLYANNIRHMMADLTPEKNGQVVHDMEDDVIRGYGDL